jgi:ABC-type methionine transport system ATPase subunit
MITDMLSAKSLSFELRGSAILSDVNIDVPRGAITILLGPSGAGKTSLLRCLSLLAHPTSGVVSINGKDFDFPAQGPINPPWPDITAVFQQHFLWPHLTLRDNILLALRLSKREKRDSIDELIRVLDLKEFIDRFPRQSSLGQRQRAAIARALALEPKFVLLDEITSALDVEQSYAVLQHLFELKRRNIGILLITHHLEFARAILRSDPKDTFVFLDGGRVVECGNADNLESPHHPRLQRFVGRMGFRVDAKSG